MSGFLQTWFFVASFIPWFLIDRVGRRPLVNPSHLRQAQNSLADFSQAPIYDQSDGSSHGNPGRTDLPSPEQYRNRTRGRYRSRSHALRVPRSFHRGIPGYCLGLSVRLVSIMAKNMLLISSRSEILPLRLRQRGSSISTAANWIFNYVSHIFMPLLQPLCP